MGQRTYSTGWTQTTRWMTDADSSKWQTVLHTAMHTLMCLIMDAPPPFPSLVFAKIWVEMRWIRVCVCVCLCMRLFLIIRRACKTTAKDRLQWIFVLSVHIYHSNRQAHKVLNWQQTVCMHVPVSVCVWLYVYFSRNGVLGRKILPTTEILLPYEHKWTTKSTLFTLENVLCQRDERINQSWGCTTSHQRMLNVLRP